jgi:hypothetical protein
MTRMNAYTHAKSISVLYLCCINVESYVSYNAIHHKPTIFGSTPRRRLYAEKESLKFVVHIEATSDPIENITTTELGNFLATTQCRDHFLSSGGTNQCIEEPITTELVQMWNDECESHYGPNLCFRTGDIIVAGESTIEFPGLKMVSLVYSGVKLQSSMNLPYYDLILIAEKKKVFGAPPIVWIYNKLTGHSAEKEGVLQPPSAKIQSILSVLELECGSTCFNFDCKAEITVEFPKVIMKILPSSKENMEEQGTASVKKALEKSIGKALRNVNDIVHEWSTSKNNVETLDNVAY